MSKTVLIGLHITKCAGTTLADHARVHLPAPRIYLCSSSWNNAGQASQEFPERLRPEDVRLIFGHYVHESLFAICSGRPMVWFTGVREPVSRSVSEYYQMCKVRIQAGERPLNAEAFLAARKDTTCKEFLRAFPTIDRKAKGSLAARAIEAAKLFDLIYSPADFLSSATMLLKLIGVNPDGIVSRNLRFSPEGDADYLAEQARLIEAAAPEHFQQDIVLFEFLAPYLGKWQPFATSPQDRQPEGQKRWLGEITHGCAGLPEFSAHLAHYFVRDFCNVGRAAELVDLLGRKSEWLAALMDAAALIDLAPRNGKKMAT